MLVFFATFGMYYMFSVEIGKTYEVYSRANMDDLIIPFSFSFFRSHSRAKARAAHHARNQGVSRPN